MKLFTPLRAALVVALLAVAAAGFLLIPAGTRLPVHWGLTGEADGFASREVALLMPLGLAGFVWILLIVVARLVGIKDVNAGRRPLGVSLTAFTGLALTIEAAIVLVGLGVAVNVVQTMAVAIGVLFVVLGNAMPKSQPNSLAGLRIPTTLRDPANWQATHRLTGLLCIVGGIVLIVAALFVPTATLIWWLLACVLVPMLIGVGYSLALARRHRAS